jgi:hypothetical protein
MNEPRRFNPTLWLVIGLPATAVVASFATLIVSTRAGDKPLPSRYHWEGQAYDADQERIAAARRLRIEARIGYNAASGQCQVVLQGQQTNATRLRLDLTHPTDPRADRHMSLERSGAIFTAACEPLPVAHWWLELADDADGWTLRTRVHGTLQAPISLNADTPDSR